MSVTALYPGLVAGVVFLLLSPHEPWGRGVPGNASVAAWLAWFGSWVNSLGVPLSFCLASSFYVPRLRDKEVLYVVFVWLAAGGGIHGAPPMGMAMFGIILLWTVLLAGERAVHGGVKGAAGVQLAVLGMPSAAIGALPLAVHLIFDRWRDRRDFVLFIGLVILGVLLLWHFDQSTRRALKSLYDSLLYLPDQPLRWWLRPVGGLLSDPVLCMAFPGCLLLRRIGVSMPLRMSLLGTMVMAGLMLGGVGNMAVFFPVFALAVGAFLDRHIAARALWMGAILGSVVAGLHIDHLRTLRPVWVQPWWVDMGASLWLARLLQVSVVGAVIFLILRSTMRVGGAQARFARGSASLGVAALTALIIFASYKVT